MNEMIGVLVVAFGLCGILIGLFAAWMQQRNRLRYIRLLEAQIAYFRRRLREELRKADLAKLAREKEKPQP